MSRPSNSNRAFVPAILILVSCIPISAPNAAAQGSRPKFPLPSTLPAVMQEEIISYWTSETGWSSELQLRNNSLQDLTVTPSLRLSDGTETALSPVTIKSQEVTSVYLDQAISAANASQLIGTYGSVVLRYLSPARASLYAAIMIRRPGHPIEFHVDASGEWQNFQAGSREGIWWLPNNTSSDYLILTNQGTNTIPLVLSIYDTDGKANNQKVSLPAHQTFRYSLRNLVESAGFAGSYGGIKVSTSSNAGSLDSLHFLFDESAGFSAILKMFDYNPKAQMAERDYAHTGQWTLRGPMLALANPDPALSFPAMGETVWFPGTADPYHWPPPFPPNAPFNPTSSSDIPATDGKSMDDQRLYPNSTFVKPYFNKSLTATQYYQYECTTVNNGVLETVMGPLAIVRAVSQNPDGSWKFTVTKPTNGLATINPLP